MTRPRRWKLIIGALIALAATVYGYQSMTPSWETVTTTYGKSDKPYGGGAFRIRDNDVISLKIAGAEIHYRVVGLDKGYNGAQAVPEEAWANDVHERLNRTTVSLLRGTLDGGLTRVFEQRGQTGAWWYSEDWRTLYVSTGWLDYKAPVRKDVLKPQITKLWRSQDGGKTWAQLNWPELQDIDRLLFVDPMRGYAIGWGPHVWRTTDGGQSWQEIKVPPQARNAQQPRKKFEAVDLGPDGTLRVAYYVGQLGEHDASSVVYRLARDQQDFELDVVLPQQVVVGLQSSQETTGRYSIYALSRLGAPRNRADREDKGHRPGVLSSWVSYPQPRVEQLHTFDDRLSVDGLDVGKRGVLLVYATDRRRAGASHDYTLSSTDFGKSWRETNDKVIQGGYFDSETNTQYGLYAYTLKKRSF